MLRERDESISLLIEGSRLAIPFNVLLAALLAVDFLYNEVPFLLVGCWLLALTTVSIVRWLFCHYLIIQAHDKRTTLMHWFIILTFFMGSLWGSAYWLMLPHLQELNEFIVILVLGGMCAGSIASLSPYLPAYWAYIIPIFLPIIGYNFYLLTPDRIILALMFFLFIAMLLISAAVNNRLLIRTFQLSREKEKLIDKLQWLSITDSLTELYNRRHFETVLQKELSREKRNHASLILILIDVDNFKQLNDEFGHLYGDRVLMETAKQIKTIFRRAHDTLFRLGGDEFSILLTNQSLHDAILLCEALNHRKAEEGSPKVTLSIGILPIPVDCKANHDELITSADKALYQAKQTGKAKIIVTQVDEHDEKPK